MASHTTPHEGQQQQQQQQHQHQQHVVQTILESFVRCFAPPLDNARGVGVVNDSDDGGGFSRAVSRSLSSSDSRKSARDYSGKKDAHTTAARRKPSAEELEERSMKRKLEIFRGGAGAGGRCREVGPKLAPRSQYQQRQRPHKHHHQQQQEPSRNSPRTVDVGSDLVSSEEDEEEILRLAQSSRRRFACGVAPFAVDRASSSRVGSGGRGEDTTRVGGYVGGNGSPISSIGKMFGDMYGRGYAASNGFLCFATPVRSASGEEGVADLNDDDLTMDEFMSRHGRTGGVGGGEDGTGGPVLDSPDSPTYFAEEESANSTFYFDQKYSHVIQTRPPMPLFQENMISCSESRMDELSKILKKKPPVSCVSSRRTTSQDSWASPHSNSNMNYEYEYGQNSSPRR